MALIITVLLSVARVTLESVATVKAGFEGKPIWIEYGFTAIFSIEYLLRLACVRHPWRYAHRFYGMVDLLAVLPTHLALLAPELYSLVDARVLRLLRVFRVFKLNAYVAEYAMLTHALRSSGRKILVFLSVVLMLAVPTGIVTAELTVQRQSRPTTTRSCHECLSESHLPEARFCRDCGTPLPSYQQDADDRREAHAARIGNLQAAAARNTRSSSCTQPRFILSWAKLASRLLRKTW